MAGLVPCYVPMHCLRPCRHSSCLTWLHTGDSCQGRGYKVKGTGSPAVLHSPFSLHPLPCLSPWHTAGSGRGHSSSAHVAQGCTQEHSTALTQSGCMPKTQGSGRGAEKRVEQKLRSPNLCPLTSLPQIRGGKIFWLESHLRSFG